MATNVVGLFKKPVSVHPKRLLPEPSTPIHSRKQGVTKEQLSRGLFPSFWTASSSFLSLTLLPNGASSPPLSLSVAPSPEGGSDVHSSRSSVWLFYSNPEFCEIAISRKRQHHLPCLLTSSLLVVHLSQRVQFSLSVSLCASGPIRPGFFTNPGGRGRDSLN